MATVMKVVSVWLLALFAAGCARTFADFEPYSATSKRLKKVVGSAVIAYEGDIPFLAQAGGEVIGSISVSGNGFADVEDIRARAQGDAADVGGTHVIIAQEGSSTSWAKISPDRVTTTSYGSTATSTYTPGAQVPITRHSGSFVVIAVPAEQWLSLPPELRPAESKLVRSNARRHQMVGGPGAQSALAPSRAPSLRENGWYCSVADDHSGLCVRDARECQTAYEELKAHGFAPCEAVQTAWCFSSMRAGNGPTLSCAQSIAACRGYRDYSFGNGSSITQECARSE